MVSNLNKLTSPPQGVAVPVGILGSQQINLGGGGVRGENFKVTKHQVLRSISEMEVS